MLILLVVRRSGACDGDGEWACAALILTHLNDEWFEHSFFLDSKNTRRTQQAKRVNKRKENLFFTLFVGCSRILVTWEAEERRREISNMQQPSTAQHTKRTIWNCYRLDETTVVDAYTFCYPGGKWRRKREKRRRRRRGNFSFEYVPRKEKKKKHDVDIYPITLSSSSMSLLLRKQLKKKKKRYM